MSFSSLLRILIWACFALTASQAPNVASSFPDVKPPHVSTWGTKDENFVAPSRLQIVSNFQSFIKSDAGSNGHDSADATGGHAAEPELRSEFSTWMRQAHGLGSYHLAQSSNDPRAPPFG
ncbi:hypothetical protein [Hyphomicrobium sp. 2TAF46]|uniref:hypothetical protein n=1 Tax=Hyphomicrobium sp. 2TAF46 TaxID=3233019 RepID=UPI003F8E8046